MDKTGQSAIVVLIIGVLLVVVGQTLLGVFALLVGALLAASGARIRQERLAAQRHNETLAAMRRTGEKAQGE